MNTLINHYASYFSEGEWCRRSVPGDEWLTGWLADRQIVWCGDISSSRTHVWHRSHGYKAARNKINTKLTQISAECYPPGGDLMMVSSQEATAGFVAKSCLPSMEEIHMSRCRSWDSYTMKGYGYLTHGSLPSPRRLQKYQKQDNNT